MKKKTNDISNPIYKLPQMAEWHIGSNVLCNYMRKPEYLDIILENKAIIPRYNMEPIGYLNVGIEKICFPMTCFCDIPFSVVSTHMSKYGRYGIGFDKKSVLEKNKIQPIHYVSSFSTLAEDFKTAFIKYNNTEKSTDTPVELLDYMVTTLMYMKPIWGKEEVSEGHLEEYIYQDESEWRFIPTQIPEGYPLILPQSDTTEAAKNYYSKGLQRHSESWFHFDWTDIRYIIVPDDLAVKHVIKKIKSIKDSHLDKNLLISKIEISRSFSSDR